MQISSHALILIQRTKELIATLTRAMSTPAKNRSDTVAPPSADMIRDSGVIQGITETLLDVAMEKGRKDGVSE